MKKILPIIFVFFLFVVQFSVLGVFFASGRIPNLFVAFAVGLVILFGFWRSLGWIIAAGFLMDVGASWPIGTGLLIIVVVSWLVEKLKVFADLRSKRYLFVTYLAILIVFSSLIFDFSLQFLLKFEHQIGWNNFSSFTLQMSADYWLKLFWASAAGLGIYALIRKIRFQPISALWSGK
jgi:hypothetical protein